MRALNTVGQDDGEKLIANQKQIEELNETVEGLNNELAEKTNRIEELCRLANDFRDDTERIKTEVRTNLFVDIFKFVYTRYFFSTQFHNYFCLAAVVPTTNKSRCAHRGLSAKRERTWILPTTTGNARNLGKPFWK